MKSDEINIHLIFVHNQKQIIKHFCIQKQTTIKMLFQKINIKIICPFFSKTKNKIGIYGKTVSYDYILKNNDRIEIYDQIKKDPKTRREQLVGRKKKFK
ncbi:MAG: RnfH family protein [Pseudomonadota bacterium]|nr:RnfH family protein [Pseudomonadota bacterium]